MNAHLSRIGFIWLDESVSAHPGSIFVQPIKPGRSCFGFTELSSVTYPECLNPTFVQRAPGCTVCCRIRCLVNIQLSYSSIKLIINTRCQL